MAICRICGQKVKRGQAVNVGTTGLRQPMQRHHKVAWENRCSDVAVKPAEATTASPSGTHPISGSQGSTTSDEGSCLSFPSSTGPDTPSPLHTATVVAAMVLPGHFMVTLHMLTQGCGANIGTLATLHLLPTDSTYGHVHLLRQLNTHRRVGDFNPTLRTD